MSTKQREMDELDKRIVELERNVENLEIKKSGIER